MSTPAVQGSGPLETNRQDPPETVEALLNRGEMEMVITRSGEILYIRQALDD